MRRSEGARNQDILTGRTVSRKVILILTVADEMLEGWSTEQTRAAANIFRCTPNKHRFYNSTNLWRYIRDLGVIGYIFTLTEMEDENRLLA